MARFLIILYFFIPIIGMAQGHKGNVEECAPMKNGKICYTDEVEIDATQNRIFDAIHAWATKNYGKDVFLSNVSANKNKGTLLVSSKIEMLLNDTEKTFIKFKMYITCQDNQYLVETREITYQYAPENDKKLKSYKAEDVIANNGKSNTIAAITDPELFCNATFFFVENLFADVFSAASEAEK
ncbi:MAG: DUF4468 domain-containing protein [Tannerellaceae bacterium]|nr:DUF4468 domain-containing protein [Tannerellaceae bacterium]MCD7913785.1 DUF4468 domain-containing protein [Tannerellaceae bacterium]